MNDEGHGQDRSAYLAGQPLERVVRLRCNLGRSLVEDRHDVVCSVVESLLIILVEIFIEEGLSKG